MVEDKTEMKKTGIATTKYLEKIKNYKFSSRKQADDYFKQFTDEKIEDIQIEDDIRVPLETPFTMRATEIKRKEILNIDQEINDKIVDESSSSSISYDKEKYQKNDILLQNIDLYIKGKKILENSSFTIVRNRIYGLVGRNGIGKSTLLKAMKKRKFNKSRGISIHLVKQENFISAQTVIEYLIDGKEIDDDERRRAILILKDIGFGSDMNQKATINIETKISDLSGGWVVRASLAKAIFSSPDLLLLDEPTNMLDIPTILWLENNIKKLKTTTIIVSHDREFLNNVCTDILHLDNLEIKAYSGTYDMFKEQRKIDMNNQEKLYNKQKADREHLQKFVDKFRSNDKRASLAQSKIKILDNMVLIKQVKQDPIVRFVFKCSEVKGVLIELLNVTFSYNNQNNMQSNQKHESLRGELGKKCINDRKNEYCAQTEVEQKFDIEKKLCKFSQEKQVKITNPIIPGEEKIKTDTNLNYDAAEKKSDPKCAVDIEEKFIKMNLNTFLPILKNVTLKITDQSRIVIVGPNGAGKSTLLKILASKLTPSEGSILTNPKTNIGYFAQQHIDHLKLEQSVLGYIQKINPDEEECRSAMAGFGLLADKQKIKTLSVGQKSRLAFSIISLKKPNILLLDEPTNHLDIESIDGLIKALNDYKGAVICVSHDLTFVEQVFEEVWLCKENTLDLFRGTIRDYKNSLIKSK